MRIKNFNFQKLNIFSAHYYFVIIISAWYSKTPMCKKKQKAIELELQMLEEANEKKKKGKKKQKKQDTENE